MDTGRIRKATKGMARLTVVKRIYVGEWTESERVYDTEDWANSFYDNFILVESNPDGGHVDHAWP